MEALILLGFCFLMFAFLFIDLMVELACILIEFCFWIYDLFSNLKNKIKAVGKYEDN